MKNPESLPPPVRTKRPPRLADAAYAATRPVHLILGTYQRKPIFREPARAALVFGFLSAHPGTLALCIMPDHVHWLLASGVGLTDELRRAKSTTTVLLQRAGWRGKVWQRGGYDRVVRDGDDRRGVARYIEANPVRAGLVASVEEWPHAVVWWSRYGD